MMHYYEFYSTYPMHPVAALLASLLGCLFYFLPSLIAFCRRHQNRFAIFLLNLLLGWSGIGWIVALVWAFTVVQPPRI